MEDSLQSFLIIDFSTPLRSARNDNGQYLATVPFNIVHVFFMILSLELTTKSLKFVLHITDDLTVEEVDDALCTCGVLL